MSKKLSYSEPKCFNIFDLFYVVLNQATVRHFTFSQGSKHTDLYRLTGTSELGSINEKTRGQL